MSHARGRNNSFRDFPLQIKMKDYRGVTTDPKIWGPALWFSLHNGAAHAPLEIPENLRVVYWSFLQSLPFWLPCITCTKHALEFIEKHADIKNSITRSRENLFSFTVDFHNYVNAKTGKPQMSYEDAYNMYVNQANVSVFSTEWPDYNTY